MTPLAIAWMLVVCTAVWGGFTALLVRAVRAEGRKRGGGEDAARDL